MQSNTTRSLLTAFASISDPRRAQGRRFSLEAILTLTVAALLANQRSVLAIAEWAADQTREVLMALGFADGATPHQTTLGRLYQRLDAAATTQVVSAFMAGLEGDERVRGQQGIAIDGKAQRGRQAYSDPPTGVVQALSAVCHVTGVVLAQEPIVHLGDQAEAELTVAPALVARLDWRGRVLTGDALFCQRTLCQQVLDAGGDYLLVVKGNQPTVLADLRDMFDPTVPAAPIVDERAARTVDHGHGRAADTRHLIASTDLNEYLAWPGVAQVFRLERTWWDDKGFHRTVRYGITSLPPSVASAERLLALRRSHWTIENRLHYVKDVTLGEDRCTVRLGSAPFVLAVARDTAVSLLRHAGRMAIASSLRYFSRHPDEILSLLGLEVAQNA